MTPAAPDGMIQVSTWFAPVQNKVTATLVMNMCQMCPGPHRTLWKSTKNVVGLAYGQGTHSFLSHILLVEMLACRFLHHH